LLFDRSMIRSFAVVAVTLLFVGPAAADTRFAIGASLGQTEGADDSRDEISTRGVFARLGLGSRFWAQAEIGSGSLDDLDDSSWNHRRGALALRADLGSGRWTPYLLGAIGGERWFGGGWDYGTQSDYTFTELGGGLDLALGDEVALGLDLRFGGRELAQSRWRDDDVVIAIVPPAPPIDPEGDYTSIRLTLTAKL
jgi:hypothetical protein